MWRGNIQDNLRDICYNVISVRVCLYIEYRGYKLCFWRQTALLISTDWSTSNPKHNNWQAWPFYARKQCAIYWIAVIDMPHIFSLCSHTIQLENSLVVPKDCNGLTLQYIPRTELSYICRYAYMCARTICGMLCLVWFGTPGFYQCHARLASNLWYMSHQIANLNVSRLVLQLSSHIHWSQVLSGERRFEQHQHAMFQLHPSDQQFYSRLRCDLY